MQDYIYSVIAFVAMGLHLTINFHLFRGRGVNAVHAARKYRGFLFGVLFYYIIDAAWGVLAGLDWIGALYVDTTLYYIAIAVSVITWCGFVIAYLNLDKWIARTLSWFGYALLALYVVMLVANLFNNCLFYFNEQGHYVSGPIRLLIFYPLVLMNIPMAIFVLIKAIHSQGHVRSRNMMVFIFCITMMMAIVLQMFWPLWPFYAIGCLFGTCFLHVFVIEDERAELRQAVIEREQTAKHMAELEKALVRARAAEKARSMFFSIVSHDIRTPLNAILGYSELLQYGVKTQAEREEALSSIRASGTTLLQLVNDVLDLAKMDSGKMTLKHKPLCLSQLTDEVFASFRLAAAKKGIALVNKTADVPIVLLDGHRFRQILFNLVGNAVKFTATGSVTVAATYAGGNLEVSVSDTGCGIPQDMLVRILDPFVQVDDPSHSAYWDVGNGLGLSICRRLVEAMGGEMIVESELGRGSTFRARIPGVECKEDQALPAAKPKPTAELKRLPAHVLVVDDSPVNRSVLTAFLKRTGVASIDHACDGAEAFAALDSAAKKGCAYDFVFSDYWMPNMSGLELVEKLRADPRFASLTVYALTADTESYSDPRIRFFSGVLLKPLTYAKLIDVFTRWG